MAIARAPERNGPGILFVLVALVVAAVLGAKYLGLNPAEWLRSRGHSPEARPETPGMPATTPSVLILHTHATENYAPKPHHAKGEPGDIVEVGAALQAALEAQGLKAVHVVKLHDYPRYGEAFANARATVTERLAQEDGIRAVVDIHRDAVAGEEAVETTAVPRPARILLVVGDTNNAYAAQNVAFAQKLHAALEAIQPGISRGVRVWHREYNGDLHPNYVLVYVGDYAEDTVEAAKAAAAVLAEALAQVLKQEG